MKIHAQTIFVAIVHLIWERGVFTIPTPIIDAVIVCVVETGMPVAVAKNRAIAPEVSALKPPIGFKGVIL